MAICALFNVNNEQQLEEKNKDGICLSVISIPYPFFQPISDSPSAHGGWSLPMVRIY